MNRLVVLLALAGVAASCSAGADGENATETTVTVPPTTLADDFSGVATTIAERPTFDDGPLAEVCPTTVSIQLDDLPSVEHGPLFELLDDDRWVDDAGQVVSAPLVRPDGTAEDITLEIRAGGPATGFRSPVDLLAVDDSITFAVASTDQLVTAADAFPALAVLNLTDVSHHMLLWDPVTYPDVETIADLAAADIEIRYATDEHFVEYLIREELIDQTTPVDGFLGEPAAFVASNGTIAQQGDALVAPFLFPSLAQWAQPIDYALAAEAGWSAYDDMLLVTPSFASENRECLGRLVPVVQDAIVAYTTAPTTTNEFMASVREQFNPLTRTASDLMDQAVESAVETGIFGNGADGTVGDIDDERLADFSAVFPGSSTPIDQLATNDFIALDRAL